MSDPQDTIHGGNQGDNFRRYCQLNENFADRSLPCWGSDYTFGPSHEMTSDPDLVLAEKNRAFVLAQYFGYLRRDPNAAPATDYTGYDFWLTKLNQFNGDYINAEMVKAFISSNEYRQRFGP